MIAKRRATFRHHADFDPVSAGTREVREHGREIVDVRVAVADEQQAGTAGCLGLVLATLLSIDQKGAKPYQADDGGDDGDPPRPRHPRTWLIMGPVGSGKMVLTAL